MNETDFILYEQPANEYIRVALKLEFLLNKFQEHYLSEPEWHTRLAVETIMEILELSERTDLKNSFLKDLVRYQSYLSKFLQYPQVDQTRLHTIIADIQSVCELLTQINQKFCQALRHDDLLNNIRLYHSNPGGIANFEVPAFHYWLKQAAHIRFRDLKHWHQELLTLEKTIRLILNVLRDSATEEHISVQNGFYQVLLDPKNPEQLIRVALPKDLNAYPEISVGRHRLTIRFIDPHSSEKALQTSTEIMFKLMCCKFQGGTG